MTLALGGQPARDGLGISRSTKEDPMTTTDASSKARAAPATGTTSDGQGDNTASSPAPRAGGRDDRAR